MRPGVVLDLLRYPCGHRYARHAHRTFDVSLHLWGSFSERVGPREVEPEPMDAVVKAAGVEHSNRFGQQSAEILRLRLDPSVPAVRELLPTGDDPTWHRSSSLARRLMTLAGTVERRGTQADLVGRVIETLATIPDGPVTREAGPRWLGRVEEAIGDRLGEPLRVRRLAAEVGRHPVHLARVFRRVHGVSVTGFIRRQRVHGALQATRSSGRSLAWIAAEYGFADQAHMCRCMRRELGLTPSALRSLAATT